jgi:hypothetical protein
MAKRRPKEQLDADKIVKKYLNELGQLIISETMDREESRVITQNLQLSQNFRVKPDKVLTVVQAFYGALITPNNLADVVLEYTPEYGEIIQKELTEMILGSYKEMINRNRL